MPKHRNSSSDSDSGPEDRNPPKKAKTASKSKSSNSDEENSWVLEKNRFIKVRDFKGKVFVDIREFYEKDGELLPGKKGISLTPKQWKKLLECKDEVEAALEKF